MGKKQSSPRVSTIAARGLDNPASLTLTEIKAVCASVVSQDETKGQARPSSWISRILTR